MEFTEFRKTYDQQLIEQTDKDYWEGLVSEQQLSSQARTEASGDIKNINLYHDAIEVFYQNAANVANAAGLELPLNDALASRDASLSAKLQYAAQVSANTLESKSRTSRMNYEDRSRYHQIARRQIALYIIALKISEFVRPGGAINYNDRMRQIRRRALKDFIEVFARLNAIVLGLREFYSVTDPSEADLKEDLLLENSRTRIEGAVAWLRKAANALARAKMDEEETIVRLTIEDKPPKLIQELKKGITVSFSPILIPNMERAHLRGISATAEHADDSWIDLEVASPKQELKFADITLPAITTRLGRVSSAASLNLRDVLGIRPITNRSPIGDWKLRALRDYHGESVERLDLDFHLSFVRV
jgi:hypothetical protein